MIVEWDNFVTKHAIKVVTVPSIVAIHIGVSTTRTDGEAIQAVVGFGPPAIENRKVQTAIENDFLTAGAGSLKWTTRVVKPNVHTLHEMASNVDVVVFNKNKLVGEFGIAHELGYLLQHALAGLIKRMGLAGEHELHRALGVIDHGGEQFNVAQDQVGALVGGKAAREADGQSVGGEYAAEFLQSLGWLSAAIGLFNGALPNEFQQP